MNINKLVIGSVVGTVVLYALGMLIWTVMFADFFAANAGSATGVEREAMIIWSVVVGTLFYGILLTLGLEVSGKKTIAGGLLVGAVVGVGIWGTADFTHYGIANLDNLTATIADTVLEGVRGAITGAVVAVVLGKMGD